MRYEFTVTLRPRLYDRTPEEQFRYTSKIHTECTDGFDISTVAELTKENNIHYHSLVELTDFQHRNKLFNRFRKYNTIFGKKSCSPIRKESDWIMYLRKDNASTKSILLCDPWIRDYFQIGGDINWKLSKTGFVYIEDEPVKEV